MVSLPLPQLAYIVLFFRVLIRQRIQHALVLGQGFNTRRLNQEYCYPEILCPFLAILAYTEQCDELREKLFVHLSFKT